MAAEWEYKLLAYKLRWKGFDYEKMEADLNELGAQGWEAVSTMAPGFGQGQAVKLTVLLKRART